MGLKKIFNKRTIKRIDDKVNLLGSTSKYDTITILGVRLITAIFFFVFIFSTFDYGYILAIVFVIIYYLSFLLCWICRIYLERISLILIFLYIFL